MKNNDVLPRPFGPYQLIRRLGVGGMAEVFAAKAEGLGGFEKLVALKVIHPRISEDEHFVQMLLDEAKLSVMLSHANIAQAFDLGFAEGRYFIVMEYVEGSDVWRLSRKLAARGSRLPIEASVYVIIETLAALEYAHTKCDAEGRPLRIVHRDVSPQNILIGVSGEVKLTDFGIAKAALRTIDTEVGVIKGKYDYMSPEQAWGDPVDRRSDVFSAGVVLHELLTGRMLYQEESVPALLDKVRRARIPRPSRLRSEVPAELDAVCLRALARRAEDRFQSASAFADALARVLYGLDPGYGAPKLARLVEELGDQDADPPSPSAAVPARGRQPKPTLPTMRRHEFVPAPTSIMQELLGPLSAQAELPDDPDETGIFGGPLPSMSFPTPPPPASDEAVLAGSKLGKGARPAPAPVSEDEETSVFARERDLAALGVTPKSPPRAARLDDAPTPARGFRAPGAMPRAKRPRLPTPPSIELDPSFAEEARERSRRPEPADESTVVDATGATARELGAMLAMAAAERPPGQRTSTPSPLPANAATWAPPARSWEPLPFVGPPLPPGGLVPLPMDPVATAAGVATARRPSVAVLVGVVLLVAIAAALVAALAN